MNYADFTTRYIRYTQTAKTASEAFKDADYATAITRPEEPSYGGFGALLGVLLMVAIFGYGFWLTISH